MPQPMKQKKSWKTYLTNFLVYFTLRKNPLSDKEY